MVKAFLSSFLAAAASLGCLAYAQPICRDLNPPFEYSSASYCPEYSGFGCCGKRGERGAGKLAAYAQEKLGTDYEKEICSDYSRNVSCLACSPLAGRIFHSGNALNERIPLCRGYCVDRDGLVSKFPRSVEELERDAAAFCEHYASDSPYCYPEVAALESEFTTPPDQTAECVCAIPIASGLHQPLAVIDPADKSNRLFISEQGGIVKILNKTTNHILEEPFLNFTAALMANGHPFVDEGVNVTVTLQIFGLMNIALHPDYVNNGRLYVFHIHELNVTNGVGLFSMNVSEFLVNHSDPDRVDHGSRLLIFSDVYERFVPGFHLHGSALFFRNGYLYISTGKTLQSEDTLDLGSYDGKLLRIDVDDRDPGREYAIPPDNPFVSDPNALPEIYAYGFGQPWRCSVDSGNPQTGAGAGRVFCGDVGSREIAEEVNIIEKGGNSIFEGEVCLVDNQTCSELLPNMILPINTYSGPEYVGINGGYVYRGCLYPNMNGMYIYGDYTGGLLALKQNASGEWERRRLCIGDSHMCPGADAVSPFQLAFGQDEGGEVYVMTTTADGAATVYQIADPARRNAL